MKISLSGVLLRAAERCHATRDARHLSHPLRQLHANLVELRDRVKHGEDPQAVLKEFFDLWVVERDDHEANEQRLQDGIRSRKDGWG